MAIQAYGIEVEVQADGWAWPCPCGKRLGGVSDDIQSAARTAAWNHRATAKHRARMAQLEPAAVAS